MTIETINQINSIWDDYIKTDKRVLDARGKELPNIDELRTEAIIEIKKIVLQFERNENNIYEFKTNIDSYNKRNNYWGFTATKGQMFFNQLVKNSDTKIEQLTTLLKKCISIPQNLEEALEKIDELENYCFAIFSKAKDKRRVPNPGSVGYFLSYFWQIQDSDKWPILYTSLVNSFTALGIWDIKPTQKETYFFFYQLNEEIKQILFQHTGKQITNWEAEHAFWNFNGNPNKIEKVKTEFIQSEPKLNEIEEDTVLILNASFDLSDYLIPKVAKLIELGKQTDKSSASKGSEYEKLVSEIFKQLDFEVETLGQGSGRNPDAY